MEYDKKYNEKIYPDLPTASAPPEEIYQPVDIGHNYRIQKINEVQLSLEQEREKRSNLSKKYKRGVKIINNIDAVLTASSVGLGAMGIGLLSTVVLAPAVLVIESVAIGAGFLSMLGKYAVKKMSVKEKKHERIKILAEAKLNTINDHISKALQDGKISVEEFSLIMSELTKFQEMKQNIKTKAREVMDEEIKNSLIEQGRKEARDNFTQYLKKS